MATLKNNSDGSLGIQGQGQLDDGGFESVNITYDANTVDKVGFVAQRAYRVKGVLGKVTAAGTDAGAVTLAVKKAPSGTAIASGTALHASTMNLKGTAATNQTLTLSTTSTDLDIAAGDSIGIDVTGTMTAATGVVSVLLAPK